MGDADRDFDLLDFLRRFVGAQRDNCTHQRLRWLLVFGQSLQVFGTVVGECVNRAIRSQRAREFGCGAHGGDPNACGGLGERGHRASPDDAVGVGVVPEQDLGTTVGVDDGG